MLTMSTISTDMVKNPIATDTHMGRCCIVTLTTRISITAIAINSLARTDPTLRMHIGFGSRSRLRARGATHPEGLRTKVLTVAGPAVFVLLSIMLPGTSSPNAVAREL
jgi:hypothetical protein